MNSVSIAGRITRKSELKQVNGSQVIHYTIVIDQQIGDKEASHFIDVTSWGKDAEFVDKFCDVGRFVGVEGELRQEKWEASDGAKRSKVVVRAKRTVGYPRSTFPASQREDRPEQTSNSDADLVDVSSDLDF